MSRKIMDISKLFSLAHLTPITLISYTVSSTPVEPLSLINALSPEQELFASFVATGASYRESARKASVHPVTGWKWMQLPAIRARVNELIEENKSEDLGGIASRAWIETHMIMIINRLESGTKHDASADVAIKPDWLEAWRLELLALMNLAKLKGLIVERKQMTRASIDLGRLGVNDLQGHLGEMLDSLEPGARQEIEQRIKRAKRGGNRKAIDTTSSPA